MIKKVTSIELSRDFSYAITMSEDIINDLVYIPHDYSGKDILSAILDDTQNHSNTICYDPNGLGVIIGDAIINRSKPEFKNTIMPLDRMDIQSVDIMLDRAVGILLNYALNSNLNSLGRMEFKRLYKEIDNLELKQYSDGKIKASTKNRKIGNTRATCFLNGLFVLKNKNCEE